MSKTRDRKTGKFTIVSEVGNRYGMLVVLESAGRDKNAHVLWKCRCDCGNVTIVLGGNLRSGCTKSCGCLRIGEKHRSWKGGRGRHSQGYVMLRAKDHPHADNRGYIFEHVSVAERALGEYLPAGSVIHHINGVKDDNRLENLWWFASQSAHMKHHGRQNRD